MTLVELLTSMTILAFVLTGILAMFTSGLHAEVDMNQRFQAQQNARLALTSMRNDIGSACSVSVPSANAGAVLQLGQCQKGVLKHTIYWCAASSNGAAPFNLYRQTDSTCASATGTREASSLKCAGTSTCTAPVFQHTASSGQFPMVTVTLPVEANLTNSHGLYTLQDTIMARNAAVGT